MARKKNRPAKVVDYESLSEELKTIYDKVYAGFNQKSIFALREEAHQMRVESPTTLNKEALTRRMTDYVISDYLPQPERKRAELNELFKVDSSAEMKCGIFEFIDGEYRVGRILIPAPLVYENDLRPGDMVEGAVSTTLTQKMFIAVSAVDGHAANEPRPRFNDSTAIARRNFEFAGSEVQKALPGLQQGERVIITQMTMEAAKRLAAIFPRTISLYVGIVPEYESSLKNGEFVVPFDRAKDETIRVAMLALERAKRLCERGENVALIVYGFDRIGDRDAERAIFGAGRCFEEGSLTVFADVDKDKEGGVFAKVATRII